jgi:hypothetical protein
VSSKIDPLSACLRDANSTMREIARICVPRYDGPAISEFSGRRINRPKSIDPKSIDFVGGKGLHKLDNLAAYLHVGDLDEGPVELKTFRTAAEFDGRSH